MQDRSRHRPLGYAAARDCDAAREHADTGHDLLSQALALMDRDPDTAREHIKDARYCLSEIGKLLRDVLRTPAGPAP